METRHKRKDDETPARKCGSTSLEQQGIALQAEWAEAAVPGVGACTQLRRGGRWCRSGKARYGSHGTVLVFPEDESIPFLLKIKGGVNLSSVPRFSDPEGFSETLRTIGDQRLIDESNLLHKLSSLARGSVVEDCVSWISRPFRTGSAGLAVLEQRSSAREVFGVQYMRDRGHAAYYVANRAQGVSLVEGRTLAGNLAADLLVWSDWLWAEGIAVGDLQFLYDAHGDGTLRLFDPNGLQLRSTRDLASASAGGISGLPYPVAQNEAPSVWRVHVEANMRRQRLQTLQFVLNFALIALGHEKAVTHSLCSVCTPVCERAARSSMLLIGSPSHAVLKLLSTPTWPAVLGDAPGGIRGAASVGRRAAEALHALLGNRTAPDPMQLKDYNSEAACLASMKRKPAHFHFNANQLSSSPVEALTPLLPERCGEWPSPGAPQHGATIRCAPEEMQTTNRGLSVTDGLTRTTG